MGCVPTANFLGSMVEKVKVLAYDQEDVMPFKDLAQFFLQMLLLYLRWHFKHAEKYWLMKA